MWCIVELKLAHDPEDEAPSVSAIYGPFNSKEDALTHYFGEATTLRRIADKWEWPTWLLIGDQIVAVVEMDHPLRVLEGGG